MKTNLTYDKAYAELEEIVNQLEKEEVQLDVLTKKIKRAKELIHFCETGLRKIKDEIENELEEEHQ
jgi:exodeoxyribonuclease VII small subunit